MTLHGCPGNLFLFSISVWPFLLGGLLGGGGGGGGGRNCHFGFLLVVF